MSTSFHSSSVPSMILIREIIEDIANHFLFPYGLIFGLVLLTSPGLLALFAQVGGKQLPLSISPKKYVSWADDVEIKEKLKTQSPLRDIECPYEYILQVYGRHHFTTMVNILDPKLSKKDPVLFKLILDVMDVVHFGAILVDDVADNSTLRKGKTAAHCIYGSSETINRAYLRIFEVITACKKQRPSMIPFILDNLTQIHEGQDISLVWRRDGFPEALQKDQALDAYRHSAFLKTGGLFRLLGQLVFASHEKDELMSKVAWYCHLQNDCKNIYSKDVITAKGALAEDLENGEYSFPIVLALCSSPATSKLIKRAFQARHRSCVAGRDRQIRSALAVLQSDWVKGACMSELESLQNDVSEFAVLWGRNEKMTLGSGTLKA